jgi:DNA polymerase elongation subunit (family B)
MAQQPADEKEDQTKTFKLLSFQAYDDKYYDQISNRNINEFRVQMFGINSKGDTASISVLGFNPFFYVMVGDDWKDKDKEAFIRTMINALGRSFEDNIISSEFIHRKKLYGFDCGKNHSFIHIQFKSEGAMRKAKGLWYDNSKLSLTQSDATKNKNNDDKVDDSTDDANKSQQYGQQRLLLKDGYKFKNTSTFLYEAQIPPLLRMFHIKQISPSGWIKLPEKCLNIKEVKEEKEDKQCEGGGKTSCFYEYSVHYKDIVSLKHMERSVPYKICSFDIEASSSHGDFPLAVKNYKKLATNIYDVYPICKEYTQPEKKLFIKKCVKTAFNSNGRLVENIDIVYPISTETVDTEQKIDKLFDEWIKMTPKKHNDDNDDESDFEPFGDSIKEPEENENEEEEQEESDEQEDQNQEETVVEETACVWRKFMTLKKKYKKDGSIMDLLDDSDVCRDTKIYELTRTLSHIFPKLQGDIVTCIGTTFLKYGDETPYLNHCIMLNSCSPIENATIESYDSEKEILLAWTSLIQREDPDIVIGYNIFGFDYQFMYLRAKELNCVNSFLRLSRNNNEVCIKRDWKTGKVGLEEKTLTIASGQHDLKFVNMPGRLQIDLYNYLRRDYQLIKYKLDYVSSYFIGDYVTKIEYYSEDYVQDNSKRSFTKCYTNNITGLDPNSFISFDEESHSVDPYKLGKKFQVVKINYAEKSFVINGAEYPDIKTKKVKWGLVKDDVTPQDIFRMTKEGPNERAIIGKYCIQDCNLVHHLLKKIDILTGFIEMSNLCSVPMDFLVMRGQGIKLTSYVAKKCRENGTLMPVIDKGDMNQGYEGAIVLPPKCDLYLNDPVACVDYSSLYPSSMISENISHDSKVYTIEYDLQGRIVNETGEKTEKGDAYKYDNQPGYKYVDISYETYKWVRKNNNPKAAMQKVRIGTKTCRFAQYPSGKGIMPSILEELLAARKYTRKMAEKEGDEFMKNILDKRQLSIKVTANSLYGQTGAKTSTFYEIDCAASTTAMGRTLLTYGKRVIEESFANRTVNTKSHGMVKTNGEYVYGDTDSVFFKFNLKELDDSPIIGAKALEITIELAQVVGKLASSLLKEPHNLTYEKTFLPFCLLSKKRYVGMLYEYDPKKGKRKSMGIVLKRRDNAPIVKDIYGGIIDILMKDKNVEKAAVFLKECLNGMVEEKYPMEKLVITKALRSGYKNPKQISHKVLADRIGKRDPGNKPAVGDRVSFVFIEHPDKKALQGERIETPEYIREKKLKINYGFYMTNQIMKPVQQLFALVLEKLADFKKKYGHSPSANSRIAWNSKFESLKAEYNNDEDTLVKKEAAVRNKEVKTLLFDPFLRVAVNKKEGNRPITSYFTKSTPSKTKL